MFVKKNDKLYIVEIEEKEIEIFAPFGKANMLLQAFLESGAVNEDLSINEFVLVASFERIAAIVLNKYDENGKLVEEGSCSNLSYTDTVKLIAVGVDIFSNFCVALKLLNNVEVKAEPEKEKKKTKKDTQ